MSKVHSIEEDTDSIGWLSGYVRRSMYQNVTEESAAGGVSASEGTISLGQIKITAKITVTFALQ